MALLLAMFQKMRLIREKNRLTLDLTKISSKKSRITKNIERVQKRYTSLFSQLESQAKNFQNMGTMFFQNQLGLGQNSVSPYSYYGINQFMSNQMSQLVSQPVKKSDGSEDETYATIDATKFDQMLAEYNQYGCLRQKVVDGQPQYADDGKTPIYENDYTAQEVAMFNLAKTRASQNQTMAQTQCQQMTSQYQNNVSIWLDAQKAALEAEQDAALDPLNYEDTMLDLEKEQKDLRLTQINEEIQSYDQLAKEEIKNSTPKFGLG